MESVEDSLQSLVQRTEQRERTILRRTVLLSIIPVAAALLLLAFIGWQISQANQQLQQTNAQLATATAALRSLQQQLATAQAEEQDARQQAATAQAEEQDARQQAATAQAEVQDVQEQIDELKVRLLEATNLDRHRYHGDLAVASKYLVGTEPNLEGMLVDIIRISDSQSIPFKRDGTSPQEGFDSPGFAAYILNKHYSFLNIPVNPTQTNLRQRLRVRSEPEVGGVVFYEFGYTMFYFVDELDQPFVIGMTPFGVVALKPDFAPVLGYGSY